MLRCSLFFIVVLIFPFWVHALFYETVHQQQRVLICCTHQKNENQEQCFKKIALELPALLEELVRSGGKFILSIPHIIPPTTTTTEDSPYYEGVRLALAWASCFFRFDGLDVEVVRADANVALNCIVKYALYATVECYKCFSPEEKFEMHIRSLCHFQRRPLHHIDMYPFKKLIKTQEIIHIKPSFPETNQKRVVITGGAGFIGSHLTDNLLAHNCQVIVLDNYFCCNDDNLDQHKNNSDLEIHRFDVCLPFSIEGRIDMIIHLASVPSPADYYKYPKETLRTGLLGTHNCLNLAVQKKARYLHASTSEVYGDPEISPQSEDYPGNVHSYGKRSQYDQSKRGAETLIALYHKKHNLDVRIARIFNTYGPRMRLKDGRVITNFIGAIINDQPVTIYGDGFQTRSFGYISDTIQGLIGLLNSGSIQGHTIEDRIFNVGSIYELSINELARKVDILSKEVFNRPARIISIENLDKTDPKIRRPDLTKINNLTGYKPAIGLDEGMRRTLQYFLKRS